MSAFLFMFSGIYMQILFLEKILFIHIPQNLL